MDLDAEFWHAKWRNQEIGFHQPKPHDFLSAYFGNLFGASEGTVFVPLCGKSLDIGWFLERGWQVVGSELSELAVSELFAGLELEPHIDPCGDLKRYSAAGLQIFAGDFFDLRAADVGKIDVIYDRAALVALPPEMRRRYAANLVRISHSAPQFLITLEYDQTLAAGPPFSVSAAHIGELYGQHYTYELLISAEVEGGLKGRCPADERAYHLPPRARL